MDHVDTDKSCSAGVKKREKVRMETCMEREETRFLENTKMFKGQNSEMERKMMCREFNQTYGRCLRHDQSCKKRKTVIWMIWTRFGQIASNVTIFVYFSAAPK